MIDDPIKTTWRLEMTDPARSRAAPGDVGPLDIRRVGEPCPEFNWFLHQAVGTDYRWGGREDWTVEDWRRHVERDALETRVGWLEGAPAGYFELERQDDGSARIQCFGLLPRFIGRGLGKQLLGAAIARCWEITDSRVWLTTCSHDHPNARRTYEALGFELVEETRGPANRRRRGVIFTSG